MNPEKLSRKIAIKHTPLIHCGLISIIAGTICYYTPTGKEYKWIPLAFLSLGIVFVLFKVIWAFNNKELY